MLFSEPSKEFMLNGNVAIQDINLSFRCSGRIKQIYTNEGRKIRKGNIIAKLDDDILKLQFDLAKAKLEESETNLENSKKDFIRNQELFKRKSISEKVFDDCFVKYKIAKAQNNVNTVNFKLALIQLNDTILKSPTDGIVLTRNIEVGEMINSGVPAFSIMPLSKTKIKSFINGEMLSKIKYNQEVQVKIDGVSKSFNGHITFISSEAEFTPKNIETKELRASLMYRIEITLNNNVQELKQGMPVTVCIGK
jgi:HlyD family secretion protein